MADQSPHPRPSALSVAGIALILLACVCTAALIGVLAYRPITSLDLAGHLAYGQKMLQTGRIVQDDSFIYPRIDSVEAADDPLVPGAYFDDQGRYHFPNANWLGQVLLAWLWGVGGWSAMNLTLIVLIAGIAAAQAVWVRRLGASWAWLPAVWLITAVVGHERFMLQPELFAFLCLLVQLCLLTGRVGWRAVGAIVVVQLLAVNLHLYWVLGVFIVGAVAAEAVGRGAWTRFKLQRPLDAEPRSRLIRLSVCALLVAGAGMVHPAGPSNATVPARTWAFIHAQQADAAAPTTPTQLRNQLQQNPWGVIGELQPTFRAGWTRDRTLQALAGVLLAAAVGVWLFLQSRRWAWAAILAALSALGFTAWRAIAFPALFSAPLIALACQDAWRRRAQPDPRKARTQALAVRGAQWAGLVLVAALSLYWLGGVVTNRFYTDTGRFWRFGHGYAQLVMPVEACRWLDEHLEQPQPAFADLGISSAVVFFADTVTAAPTANNGWAITPRRMGDTLALSLGAAPIRLLDQWRLDLAVLPAGRPLARALLDDRQWALVRIEPAFVVFARRSKANATLIAAHKTSERSLDLDDFLQRCGAADPAPLTGLISGATLLQDLGWLTSAERVWRACVADPDGQADLLEARRCLLRAMDLPGGRENAQRILSYVERDIAQFGRAP